jgi:16S rRNA (guanine(966)-N(2))-methyltransferase RsmD
MRIISGIHGGRRIKPPTNMPYTRPTTDMAKEGLFNILQNYVDYEGLCSLDLFGGTGCISYELASRGATDLTIVEMDTSMFNFIKKTSEELKIDNFKLIRQEVFSFIQYCNNTFDFIFAGPPYALSTIDDLPDMICSKTLLKEDGVFVLEHTPRNNYEKHPHFFRTKNYGTTVFSFFKRDATID